MPFRAIVGFVAAPLVAVATVLLLMTVTARNLGEVLFWVPFLLPAAFTYAMVLGIPFHFVLTRLGWRRAWHYALAGIAIGLVPPLVLRLATSDGQWHGIALAAAMFGLLAAPVGALAFWGIVRSKSSPPAAV